MADNIIQRFTPRELRVLPIPSVEEAITEPLHGEVRKIAETVLGGLKYAFAATVAGAAGDVVAGSVEESMRTAFGSLAEDRQKHYREVAEGLVSAPPRQRAAMFGSAGELDAKAFVSRGGFGTLSENVTLPALDLKLLGIKPEVLTVPLDQLKEADGGLRVVGDKVSLERLKAVREDTARIKVDSGVVESDRLTAVWGSRTDGDPFAGVVLDDDFQPFAGTDKLGIWVTEVRCVDETNPEFWGSDEIGLGAVETDEDGDVKQVPETYIGGGFDDGDYKTYADWRYTWFNLNEGKYWPKRYSVSFVLAEKDSGGLQAFLNDIWAKIRDQVKEAIAKAVGSVASAYLGPVIGQAIGQAVAWVVGVFVQWLINLFGDDIFPVQTVSVTTPSASARWYYPNGTWGNPSSGVRVANFYGHGGHYQVKYYWKFHS